MDDDIGGYDMKQGRGLDLLGSDSPRVRDYEQGGDSNGLIWSRSDRGPSAVYCYEEETNGKHWTPPQHTNRTDRGQELYEDPITRLFEDLF